MADLATTVAVPQALPMSQAAALLQVGPAAFSLIEAAELELGQRVLVTGAGGALGLALVELAARAGAHVVGSAHGAAKRERALELGAAQAVDYPDVVAGDAFDVVFDGVGGQVGADAFAIGSAGTATISARSW
ncbi:hypothetical protein GCM10022224_082040 [Nonomuraea antimicrobica]|uniref:Alcohol dehydrogenase-like C-terminal domain-containing protein n=1 Tax=Nonomuraea antimicrobica TaxID=561173 RepID=A0ABP7DGE9_9ACTN